MNEPSHNPGPARDLAAELAALSGLNALDGEEAHGMEHCHDCPFGRAAMAALGYEETVAAMTASQFPPVEPRAEVEDMIMAKIDAEELDSPATGYHFIGDRDGDWQSLPGGKIRLKILSDDPGAGHSMMILEADPGAVFFPHAHRGTEEVFLIDGDLDTVGRTLRAGDYLRADPGTRHQRAVSNNGCRALLVTARENHPRTAIAAYSGLLDLFKKLGGSKQD